MRFTQRADEAHPCMYRWHILEHEGNGMRGQFTVDQDQAHGAASSQHAPKRV